MLLVDIALATAMKGFHSMVSTMLQTMPGGLAYSQDMSLNISIIADCNTILASQEQLVFFEVLKANIFHYQMIHKVIKYDKSLKGKLKL